jgi:hypothetical protein
MLFVSTRQRFRHGDPGWDGYVGRIELPHLLEVRTLDAGLNKYVDRCGCVFCDLPEIDSVLDMLPRPTGEREYYLLGSSLESESPESFHGFEFLGCDLSDETMTSSVLNCGPWKGRLAPFVKRLNSYGLLSPEDAREAKRLLPLEWGVEEPHAAADIWALYGRVVGMPDNKALNPTGLRPAG